MTEYIKRSMLFFALTLLFVAGFTESAQSQIRIGQQNLKESDLPIPGSIELGDADYILNPSTTPEYIYLTQALTANRTITLTATSVTKRKVYWFVRNTVVDGFDWIIQGLDTLQTKGEKTLIHYDGSAWQAISFTEPQEPEFLGSNPGTLNLGDADYTFDPDVTPEFVYLAEPLTADRTVTLTTTGMTPSKKYWFIRNTEADGFNLIIGGIGILSEKDQKILVHYDGINLRGIFFPAEEIEAATNLVHVETSGNGGSDAAGCGGSGNPCETIPFAITQASPGQIIQIGLGIFTLTSEIDLPIGISIRGSGIDQTTITGGTFTRLIDMGSTAPVKLGDQKISKLTLDGNSTNINQGIWCTYRSEIVLDSVKFVDFFYAAAIIRVTDAGNDTPPANWLTGIRVTNCIFINSARDDGDTSGVLEISALDGGLIEGNTINEDEGYGIKFGNSGWYKNTIVRNNNITVPTSDPTWVQDIGIELWNLRGNNKIYNNTVNTWISLVRGDKGVDGDTLAVMVYDNQILQDAGATGKEGIEVFLSDVLIRDNHFENYGALGAVAIWGSASATGDIENIQVYRNTGTSVHPTAQAGVIWSIGGDIQISDVKIWNNTFEANTWGWQLRSFTGNSLTVNNMEIINNIFLGDAGGADVAVRYVAADGTDPLIVNDAIVTHNVVYQYGGFTESSNNGFVTKNNHTLNNIITTDPNLDVNFEPQAGSDAIDAGTDVGLPFNGSNPDIGAVETSP